MFLVFTNQLNPNERIILEKMLNFTGVLPFGIYDVGKDALPPKEDAIAHYGIFVFDPTKGKPALIKRLEALYGKEYLEQEHLEIARPKTFQTKDELKTEVWDKLVTLRQKVNIKDVYFGAIPYKLPQDLLDILTSGGQRNVYNLQLGDDTLEIRPREITASKTNSLTYEEFAVLFAARYVFGFENATITNS